MATERIDLEKETADKTLAFYGLQYGPFELTGEGAPKRWSISTKSEGKDVFVLDKKDDVLYAVWTCRPTQLDAINYALHLFLYETREGFLKDVPYQGEIRIFVGDDEQGRLLTTVPLKEDFSFDDYKKTIRTWVPKEPDSNLAVSTILFDTSLASITCKIGSPTNAGYISVAFKDFSGGKMAETLFKMSSPWKRYFDLPEALSWLIEKHIKEELQLMAFENEKTRLQQELPKP